MHTDPPPSPLLSQGHPKWTALVVEDDPRLRAAMSRALAVANFHVLAAAHCDAAIAQLEVKVVHIVCVDIALPDRSGYELCEQIRGPLGLSRVPILAMGDHGTAHDVTQAEQVGASAFLLKPFSTQRFTECVQRLLDGPAGRARTVHERRRVSRCQHGYVATMRKRCSAVA